MSAPQMVAADPTAGPVGRDKTERKRLATLDRRIAHLREVVTLERPGVDWDRAELKALEWAMTRIADAERAESAS